MRKIGLSLLIVFLFSGISSAGIKTTIAILDTTPTGVSEEDMDVYASDFRQTLVRTGKFKVVDRARVEALLKEQAFQTSGMVEAADTSKIGKVLGVDKMLSLSLVKDGNDYTGKADIMDVTTGQLSFTVDSLSIGSLPDGKILAGKVAAEFSIMGQIVNISGDEIYVDIGSTDGLRPKQTIFVARKGKAVKDDAGKVIFQEIDRIGKLRVKDLQSGSARAEVYKLINPKMVPKAKDLVSPDPIPRKETLVSETPLNKNPAENSTVLSDNMADQQLLPTRKGFYADEAYVIDQSEEESGFGTSFYNLPSSLPEKYVLSYKQIVYTGNKWGGGMMFNTTTDKDDKEWGYVFLVTKNGEYQVSKLQKGGWKDLTSLLPHGAIKKEGDVNEAKIIVNEGRMDFYVNDQFVTGVEDESYHEGTVGFLVNSKNKISFDDVSLATY